MNPSEVQSSGVNPSLFTAHDQFPLSNDSDGFNYDQIVWNTWTVSGDRVSSATRNNDRTLSDTAAVEFGDAFASGVSDQTGVSLYDKIDNLDLSMIDFEQVDGREAAHLFKAKLVDVIADLIEGFDQMQRMADSLDSEQAMEFTAELDVTMPGMPEMLKDVVSERGVSAAWFPRIDDLIESLTGIDQTPSITMVPAADAESGEMVFEPEPLSTNRAASVL